MYGYKNYIPLTEEEILKRVSQEDVFKIVFQEDIVVDKEHKYLAPYRNDTHPDCYFMEYDGYIKFVDFAEVGEIKSSNCFKVISKTFNISYRQALEYVNNHFKLGLGDSTTATKEILYENGPIKVEEINKELKKPRTITYLPRSFSSKDKTFWSKYEISKQNLLDDKVVPISMYRSTNKKGQYFIITAFDIMYAYTDFDDNKIKVYRPQAPKEGKWFTNCNQNDIGNIGNIDISGDKLIIAKSYKDCRVLRNQGIKNVIWFQNEGMIPSENILKQLCKRFNKIYLWFDNDSAGLANGKFVASHINSFCPGKVEFIFLPPKLLREYDIKDPSDLIATLGRDKLREFLTQKKLLDESNTENT